MCNARFARKSEQESRVGPASDCWQWIILCPGPTSVYQEAEIVVIKQRAAFKTFIDNSFVRNPSSRATSKLAHHHSQWVLIKISPIISVRKTILGGRALYAFSEDKFCRTDSSQSLDRVKCRTDARIHFWSAKGNTQSRDQLEAIINLGHPQTH